MTMLRCALATLVTLAPLGCVALTTMRGPADGFTPFAERRDPATGLCDWKGIVHCHSYLSHDSRGKVADIAAACASVGIDFVIMTDHQTPHSVSRGQRGFIGKTLFIVGGELRTPEGTLLAFPLRRYVRPFPSTQEVIDDVHAQGALAFIGHAEGFRAWSARGLDGMEIVNLHAAARVAPKAQLVLQALFLVPYWLFRTLSARPDEVLAGLDRESRARWPFPVVGGNDAHENVQVFGPLGGTIGTYEELFKVLSTHVLAERLDEKSIVGALRKGRSYVVFDLFRDATGFDFHGESGGARFLMGDTAPRGATLVVRVPSEGTIHLLRDGVEVMRVRGKELRHAGAEVGVWRVEVTLEEDLPWIYSSGIRVGSV